MYPHMTGGPELSPDLISLVKRRGPDSFRKETLTFFNPNARAQQLTLQVACSVLALRGNRVVQQPLQDSTTGSLLCWNGEAWHIGDKPITEGNDGDFIFRKLLDCYSQSTGEDAAADLLWVRLRAVLASIVGPFSFLFYEALHGRIFYGRDSLGRRSLMISHDDYLGVSIASTSSGVAGGTWTEVDTQGIYEIDLVAVCRSNDTRWSYVKHTELTPWASIKKPMPPLNRDSVALSVTPRHAQDSVVNALYEVLSKAVATRLVGIESAPATGDSGTKLAVLFSGGLDCTLLARLAHEHLPMDEPIDLLNVAFENPRVILAARRGEPETLSESENAFEKCPDRVTGRRSHQELVEVCGDRVWNFVALDIPYLTTQAHRDQVISLMYPHDTEMDLSIALALYFASCGQGILSRSDGLPVPYSSGARVLISGLGADELFGGYGRHAISYQRGGESALADELELDFQRIGTRNLGRDDRVISHWSKEVRYPFLDEDVVGWALQQPVMHKCDFAIRPAEGEGSSALDPAKGALRELARRFGMTSVCNEKKRAIQFGARSAKMHQTGVKGTQKLGLQPH